MHHILPCFHNTLPQCDGIPVTWTNGNFLLICSTEFKLWKGKQIAHFIRWIETICKWMKVIAFLTCSFLCMTCRSHHELALHINTWVSVLGSGHTALCSVQSECLQLTLKRFNVNVQMFRVLIFPSLITRLFLFSASLQVALFCSFLFYHC